MSPSFGQAQEEKTEEVLPAEQHLRFASSASPAASDDTTAVLRGQGKDEVYVFIPDEASPSCLKCNEPFTFFYRRHHVSQRAFFLPTYPHIPSSSHTNDLLRYGLYLYLQCRACGSLVCHGCLTEHQDLLSVFLGQKVGTHQPHHKQVW